jgi:electron transport complex protein RnfG
MGKIKSTLPDILLSLTITCIVSGAALSATNTFTEKAVAATMETELRNAIKNVLPEFDNTPAEELYKLAVTGGDSLTIYPAKNAGQPVGYAIESYSKNGFSGLIRVLVGFDSDGKLHNFSILEHSETPGLGSKMQEWFSTDKNRQSVLGRDMTKGAMKVSKDGGDVDAITASTISSRAFLEAINLAYSVHSGNGADGASGATNVGK